MRSPSAYEPLSKDWIERLEAAGIDLAPIAQHTRSYTRRGRGKQLHEADCSALKDVPGAVTQTVNPLQLHEWDLHHTCTRWKWRWPSDFSEYLQAGLVLASIETQVATAIEGRKSELLLLAEETLTHDTVQEAAEAIGLTEWIEERQKRISDARAQLKPKSAEEKLRPYLVKRLAMPRESPRVAGCAPGSGALPVIAEVWDTWKVAVFEELDPKTTRSRLEDTLSNQERYRQSQYGIDLGKLEKLWEKELRAACRAPQTEVYYALEGRNVGGTEGDALRKIKTTYPYAEAEGRWHPKILMRVPETVAWWLEDSANLSGKWLGPVGDDDLHVLETTVALWGDDTSSSGTGAAAKALATAQLL